MHAGLSTRKGGFQLVNYSAIRGAWVWFAQVFFQGCLSSQVYVPSQLVAYLLIVCVIILFCTTCAVLRWTKHKKSLMAQVCFQGCLSSPVWLGSSAATFSLCVIILFLQNMPCLAHARGGYPSIRHNKLLLKETCHAVATEPNLQPIYQ